MLNSYHMAIVNIIATLIFGISLLIYKLKYPKKKINLLLLLIVLSLLPLISMLRQGTYESGDLSHHALMILSMSDSLLDGNIIPRWGAGLHFEYGGPYHIIQYFLPRYIASLIHILGIPLIISIKIILASTYILSGITMFYFVKNKIDEKSGFIAGLLYLFAPYHFVDMHFRVELGEMATFTLLPFLLYSTDKFLKFANFKWTLIISFSLAMTILSHQAISLLFIPFLILYFLIGIYYERKLVIIKSLKYITALILGILLSSFYWITVVTEGSKYTWVHYIFKNLKSVPFLNFSELIYSPWRSGFLFQGPEGELSFLLGYAHWIFIIIAVFIIIFIKTRKNSYLLYYSVIGFATVLFFMTKYSEFLWTHIPLIKYSQNSYRLLVLLVFFASLAGGAISQKLRSWLILGLCLLAILSTILNWGNRRAIAEISDDSYFKYILSTHETGATYDFPIWVDPEVTPYKIAKHTRIQIISGKGDVKELFRNSTTHKYLISSTSSLEILDNTFYFPGWKVVANNKEIPINYKNPKSPGVISFKLPAGVHRVDVVFRNTPTRNLADGITFVTLLSIGFAILIRKLR